MRAAGIQPTVNEPTLTTEGPARAPGAGVGGKRSQDGEAQTPPSERRAEPAASVRRRGTGRLA
jgi:hypothetical protein